MSSKLCLCVSVVNSFLRHNGDRNVAIVRGFVAGEVRGEDAEGVVAGRERRGVPGAALGAAVADGVGDFVEEARLLASVDGDAALVGVGDLGRVAVGGQAVELDLDARLL